MAAAGVAVDGLVQQAEDQLPAVGALVAEPEHLADRVLPPRADVGAGEPLALGANEVEEYVKYVEAAERIGTQLAASGT